MSVEKVYEIHCDYCKEVIIYSYDSTPSALNFMKKMSPEPICKGRKQCCDIDCYNCYLEGKRLTKEN